jgi:hypothetical protein
MSAQPLGDSGLWVCYVVEALDAHDEVERLVREGKELGRDDVRDSVRVAWNVQAGYSRRGWQEVVVRPRAAEHVEDVDGAVTNVRQGP